MANLSTVALYKFQANELVVINCLEPAQHDRDGEWANSLCNAACQLGAELYAPDYDGTTGGDTSGINVLIPEEDLGIWFKAADQIGARVYTCDLPIEAGIFGDSNQTQELIEGKDGSFYWVPDSTMTPAAILGRSGGSAKSEAKKASSKANGAKGGRPKKVSV